MMDKSSITANIVQQCDEYGICSYDVGIIDRHFSELELKTMCDEHGLVAEPGPNGMMLSFEREYTDGER